jgi:predicted nuclease of predicted toxin-antitoxin system
LRFLADENVPAAVVEALRARGDDVEWIRTNAPGSSDPLVLAAAQAEDQVLLTFDKDFGDLAFRLRLPATSGIILVE